ncbi:MAG: hypothetical protein RR448_04950 [Niameybacter sp.]
MRQTVNWGLLEIEYNEKNVKRLFNNMESLEINAERGCSTSASIKVDLENALYLNPSLSDNERGAIIGILIKQLSQTEHGQATGISQRMGSHYVKQGIKKTVAFLNGGK